jgi:MFS family permease
MSLISERNRRGWGRAILRRLLQIDHPVLPRSESEIEAEVERNYRWNFTFNLLDGSAFWFGFHFVSASTIIPLFVSKLTLNPFVIGLVAVCAQAGWYLPQLLTAGYIERLARKKPVVINLGFLLERLPIWLWPLAALLTPAFPDLALIFFFLTYAWFHLGAGLIAPAWQDLIARCFPVNRRGRFFGLTSFIGTGAGTLGAALSSWLLETYAFPFNFVYIFLIAAASISISWLFLAQTREPVQGPPPASSAGTEPLWPKLRGIVRRDHNFRRFLQARLVMALGLMGLGFVTVAAVQRWQVPDSVVGFYTAALLIGQATGNLLSGLLADRFGHKFSLELGVASAGVAFVLAWLAPVPAWYYAVFLFLGYAVGAEIVSGLLITMEFSAPAQRPTYIGVTNTIVGLASGVAPLIGGWLAGLGYDWLFLASMVINLVSLILFRYYVGEPRQHPVAESV